MLGLQKSNIEFFSKWICPYEECGAENDITNSVRCWKCNKKKPSKSTYKRITNKIKQKKEKQDAAELENKKELMNIKEDDFEESSTAVQSEHQETNLEFDLDKLQS